MQQKSPLPSRIYNHFIIIFVSNRLLFVLAIESGGTKARPRSKKEKGMRILGLVFERLINGDHNTAPPPAGCQEVTIGTRSGVSKLITTGPPP